MARPQHGGPWTRAVDFQIGGVTYMGRPIDYFGPLEFRPLDRSSSNLTLPQPVTVVRWPKRLTQADQVALHISRELSRMLTMDDVIELDFMNVVIFTGVREAEVEMSESVRDTLDDFGVKQYAFEKRISAADGPYYLTSYVTFDILYEVWKVYPDPIYAFLVAVWPSFGQEGGAPAARFNAAMTDYSKEFSEVPIPARLDESQDREPIRRRGVAVPSRLYRRGHLAVPMARLSFGSMPPAQVRLDGIRIAVKDNMHLWGLRTSIGSKAYHEWHGTRRMNAACVASLMEAGAQIVGKTHLSAFAAMDHPTQGREFQAPTNVRGDRFQICGGSSDGTAAALAAYDWLDAGIGTDTAGGMRFPAHQTGLFSLRTSSGLISSDGIVEAWERLHIPGVMARDLGVISQILDVWHHAQTRRPEDGGHRRVVLLIPREHTMVLHDREQESIMLQFVGELCGRLGCEYRTMSIEEDWPLLEFGGEPLPDFFYSLVTRGWWHAHYQSFHDFREAFRFKNLIYPYTTDHVSQMWEVGSSVTDADHEGMNRRIEEFREWFLQRYFSDPGERVFFMFPVADVEPRYRDAPQPKDIPIVHGLPMSYIAPILGAPELVVPIGEIWFTSQRTRDREALPVVASFMSTPGTDRELVEWVMEALRICGRPTEVKTGSREVDTPRPYG